MRRHRLTFLLLLAGFSFLSAAPTDTAHVQSLLREGDSLTNRYENAMALEKYLSAFRLDSTNAEILWRISRAYIDIGEHLPIGTEAQKARQLSTYETAESYADRAVRADRKNSMAFTRRAIANGRIALFRGIWESLSLVKATRADIDTALALDPGNDVALYIMGRIHAKVTEKPRILRWPLGLGWANIEDGILFYEKAIALKPEYIMYRLDCARAYVEDGRYEMARKHLSTIERLSNSDEDDDQFRKEAEELMKEIREKKD